MPSGAERTTGSQMRRFGFRRGSVSCAVRAIAIGLFSLVVAGCSSSYRSGHDLIDDFDRHYDYVAQRYFGEPSRLNSRYRKSRRKRHAHAKRRRKKNYASRKTRRRTTTKRANRRIKVASRRKAAANAYAPAKTRPERSEPKELTEAEPKPSELRPSVQPTPTPDEPPKRVAKLVDPALENASRPTAPPAATIAPVRPVAPAATGGFRLPKKQCAVFHRTGESSR